MLENSSAVISPVAGRYQEEREQNYRALAIPI